MDKKRWHALSKEKIFNILKTETTGLTDQQVKERQSEHGLNELARREKSSSAAIFFSQFKSPLIYILVIAAVVSFILGEKLDSSVIIGAVIVNTVVGFLQENKAQNALAKLRQAVVVKTRVKRDGEEIEINAKFLVPGDIIVLASGDQVPADARILVANKLAVNEAALTGESWEVNKNIGIIDKDTPLGDRRNMLFMGTLVTSGRAKAVIVDTGVSTEIGHIATLLESVEDEQTPLQIRFEKLSKQIGLAVFFVAFFIFIFGIFSDHKFIEIFEIAVAVAVSAIPEGMVVALTVVLAIGMQKIMKQKGLVRKLVAAEALGSTTVICTDKTGTLTTGEMKVAEVITDSFHFDTLEQISFDKAKKGLEEILDVLKIGVLCNEAVVEHSQESMKDVKIFGNMTERALLLAGLNFGLHKTSLAKDYPEIDVLPFDSKNKYMATLHNMKNGHKVVYVKGAPENILYFSKYLICKGEKKELSSNKKEVFVKKFEKLSSRGLRILAVAYKDVDDDIKKINEEDIKDLVFVGFVGIKDPIRGGVKKSIDICEQAGVRVVMITGDYQLTAKAIAEEIGLKVTKGSLLTGSEFEVMSDKEFYEKVKNFNVYARVTPADKLRIISAWQHNQEVVAMTGDGVNDAPALKKADIGVAMGSGTEVAKGASDLVILDDRFSTIVSAIEQGRIIYDNIKKVILFLLSDSLAEVIIIIFALIIGWPLPLLATQILWINIINDGLPGMALTLDPGDSNVMNDKPNEKVNIFDNENKVLIFLISTAKAITTLAIFYYFWKVTDNKDLARTLAFTGLAISTLMYVFSLRNLRVSFINSIRIKNWYLVGAVFFGLIMQLTVVYVPFFQKLFHTVGLGYKEWLVILLQGVMIIAVVELIKGIYLFKRKYKGKILIPTFRKQVGH